MTSLKHDEDVHHAFLGIEIDHLPESGYVEQLIEDNYLSPFPLVQSTERPDRVISGLMEGRVAILLDGKPFVLLVQSLSAWCFNRLKIMMNGGSRARSSDYGTVKTQ